MQANLSYNEGYGHTCTSSVAVGPAIGSGRFNQSYAAVTAFRDVYRTRTPIPSVPPGKPYARREILGEKL